MQSLLKKALSIIPIMTILGWIFPELVSAFQNWQANKTPENVVKLGEAAANELAKEFDPALLPQLEGDEHIAEPAITTIILAAEEPSVNTIETAILQTSMSAVEILKDAGLLKTDVTEEEIKNALLPVYQLLADAGLK